MSKRILAIHAHPDDVEILCGGTIVLLAAAGHAVTIVSMTPGDLGSTEMTPEETARTRRQEAATSARIIGADYLCAEFRDYVIFNDDSSRRRVTEILRKTHPDLILTSSPVDYMADHEATSMLVRDACFSAPIPNYATGDREPAAPLKAIPHLYFMDPIGGVDRDERAVPADVYIDVTSTFETKRRMLMEHRSQREWLLKHHGMDDYILQMEAWTRLIGSRAGLAAGEGFRLYRGHPYPQTPLLEELLPGSTHRALPA